MTPLQVDLILADRRPPDEHVTLQPLHGAADRHQHRVDLDRDLPRRGQDQNLQDGVRG